MSYDTILRRLLRIYAAASTPENAIKLANHVLRGSVVPPDEDYVQEDPKSLDSYDGEPLTYKDLLHQISLLSVKQLNSSVVIRRDADDLIAATSFVIGESDEERHPRREHQRYLVDEAFIWHEDGTEGPHTVPLNPNHPLISIEHCECGIALSQVGSWDNHRGGTGPWGGYCADCISGG